MALIKWARKHDAGASIFDVYDSFDQYFHEIYGELFDPDSDDFTETLQRQFKELSAGTNVLLVDDVEVLPAYRGRRVGLVAVHRLIDVFGAWDCLVIIPIYHHSFMPAVTTLIGKKGFRSIFLHKTKKLPGPNWSSIGAFSASKESGTANTIVHYAPITNFPRFKIYVPTFDLVQEPLAQLKTLSSLIQCPIQVLRCLVN